MTEIFILKGEFSVENTRLKRCIPKNFTCRSKTGTKNPKNFFDFPDEKVFKGQIASKVQFEPAEYIPADGFIEQFMVRI